MGSPALSIPSGSDIAGWPVQLYGLTWEEIKARNPGFVASWKPGDEPRNQSGL